MTIRRLAMLQWVGLLFGAAAWASQHIAGYGLTEAECHAPGARWNITNDPWQLVFLGLGAAGVLVAMASAVTVVLRTRGVSYDEDDPPLARMRFFAIASLAANVFFLMMVLLSSTAAVLAVACRQS